VEPVTTWFTPMVWWGYILMVDGLNGWLSGSSLLAKRREEFILMALSSIPCRLLFEYYNIYLEAWHPIGFPAQPVVRYACYAVTFAAFFPALFETAELVENTGLLNELKGTRLTSRVGCPMATSGYRSVTLRRATTTR
ncbi:MAG: hypothetical protein HC834_06505, partial [Rhodospirillales bacterium]|nr:hypothetical protein [Rhodospirillales bacterium]